MKKIKLTWRIVLGFIAIITGAFIAAFAIEGFLVPCGIMDGGIVGVSMVIGRLTGLSISIITIVLNIPFLIIGARKNGMWFLIRSAVAMAFFSIALSIFEQIEFNITSDHLLAVCFGGVILGFGCGVVIRFGGCLDGTESAAILINKKYKLPVGRSVLIFNVILYTVCGVLFGFEPAMLSLLTYFIASRVLDLVENGIEKAKAVMIFTEQGEKVSNELYTRLGRTCTTLSGEGYVSGRKDVLYCVVTSFEVREVRNIVDEQDIQAFVTVTDVSEIIGSHIKKRELPEKKDV